MTYSLIRSGAELSLTVTGGRGLLEQESRSGKQQSATASICLRPARFTRLVRMVFPRGCPHCDPHDSRRGYPHTSPLTSPAITYQKWVNVCPMASSPGRPAARPRQVGARAVSDRILARRPRSSEGFGAAIDFGPGDSDYCSRHRPSAPHSQGRRPVLTPGERFYTLSAYRPSYAPSGHTTEVGLPAISGTVT